MLKVNIFHIAFFILVYPPLAYSQFDNVGAGRALRLDGIDDYVDLGNVYDDLSFPFTITAWISIDPSQSSSGGIFDSQNTLDTHYNGFWFAASPSIIAIEYGDGKGTNNPAFRHGKAATGLSLAGSWNHVSAVVKGISDIDIFLNGYKMESSFAGNSDLPMDSSFPNDNAHIGNHFINGIYYRFKGMIDELRIFNRAVSEEELRKQMCRSLAGDEDGLIGYWTFDETSGNILKDHSINGFDGTLKGNPTRVFSGAPIGDESIFLYTTSWTNATLANADIVVNEVTGNPFGIHIYKINDIPSQTIGLGSDASTTPYYGVFVADRNKGNTFTLHVENPCKVYYRADNSQPEWMVSDNLNSIQDRREFVLVAGAEPFQVSLGEDQIICDKASHLVGTDLGDMTGKTFTWSTGESTPSITARRSGLYSVIVTDGCSSSRDSVFLSFLKTPPVFSLGENQLLCDLKQIRLQPDIDEDYEWIWSDGSSGKNITVTDYGVYWLEIKNACGSSTDSIIFSELKFDPQLIPNCITPNGDASNEYFILPDSGSSYAISIFNRWGKKVYESAEYKNTWNASGLASGIYYYVLSTKCFTDIKGAIQVFR